MKIFLHKINMWKCFMAPILWKQRLLSQNQKEQCRRISLSMEWNMGDVEIRRYLIRPSIWGLGRKQTSLVCITWLILPRISLAERRSLSTNSSSGKVSNRSLSCSLVGADQKFADMFFFNQFIVDIQNTNITQMQTDIIMAPEWIMWRFPTVIHFLCFLKQIDSVETETNNLVQ